MLGGLILWLWPIGLGGKMPVGGDVTQFAIGLMAVLGRSIRSGRLPLWNDLWGYGFPGVAESQMGVFYPPHLVLYGLLSTELAYTVNLVIHTLWCGLGAAWAARRFGISPWGAALAGLCWGASGFFLIHLPHHWASMTASWMPWALGLGWSIITGRGDWRAPWALAVVLALQVLPGHFQLAFCTQVCLLGMALWALVERPEGGRTFRRVLALVVAMAAVVPLDAMQLWPTFKLAQLAATRRDFEYLSGFAATPLHLVSYFAPGLFHRSPLWRPVAWDPFHTSPEEHLAYIGLAPLFLALGAVRLGWRRDAGTRVLTLLAVGTLILSLGPYVPGFELWSQVPGFSFFRAPARWGLATALALALLAGKGFDALRDWPRPGWSLARFLVLAIAAPALVLAVFELGLASTEGRGWPMLARGFDATLRALPWRDDPSFREVIAVARRPQGDQRVLTALAREGLALPPGTGMRLGRERFRIYVLEWGETGLLIGALLALIPFAGRRRAFAGGLLVLTLVDLGCVGRHRTIDVGPIRPLTTQSPVLARLADEPRGTRTIDGLRNLPMVAGAAPVSAYRTLDLPVLELLTALAHSPMGFAETDPLVRAAMRATGAGIRILSPDERAEALQRQPQMGSRSNFETIPDPALASWLFGADWVASVPVSRGTTFALWRTETPPSRAWFVPILPNRTFVNLTASPGQPSRVLDVLRNARPLAEHARSPECLEIAVPAQSEGAVVISQLDYPEWRGVWVGPRGESPAAIARVFGGWQAVEIPGRGEWTLRLEYQGRDVRLGLAVSGLAWITGLLAFLWRWRRESRRTAAPAQSLPESIPS